MGIGVDRLPDFLSLDGVTNFDLLGQDELSQRTLDTVLEVRAAKNRIRVLADDDETSRLVEHEIRIGQHRFAKSVLDNFAHTCGFCGFEPRSIPRNKLLVATGPSAPRCHRPKSPAQGPLSARADLVATRPRTRTGTRCLRRSTLRRTTAQRGTAHSRIRSRQPPPARPPTR